VEAFGEEWSHFDQSGLSPQELQQAFAGYFHIFPWERLPANAVGFDLGCGSGRWATIVAQRVGTLHCIDPSAAALDVAKRNLGGRHNCIFHLAGVEDIPLSDESADFGYSLGVLHHVPDTSAALRACTKKLKSRAPFLVYLYYAFDNKPLWYSTLWRGSEIVRKALSRSPFVLRLAASQMIATTVYWPLAKVARIAEKAGLDVDAFPLSYYRDRSFYTMRTDALDRFGTRLEQRFTRDQIRRMLSDAGLENIAFSDRQPYWCAVGFKR
jgi:SAM-dependent methyltransferase